MHVPLSGHGLRQLQKGSPVRKGSDAEHGQPGRQIQREGPCAQFPEQSRKAFDRARLADRLTDEAPQMRLPGVVRAEGPTECVDIVPVAPLLDQPGRRTA